MAVQRLERGDLWKSKAMALQIRLRDRFRVTFDRCLRLRELLFARDGDGDGDDGCFSSTIDWWLRRFRDFRRESLPSSSTFYRKRGVLSLFAPRMLALLTVFNSWAFLETRRLVQVFPEHVRKLWNDWELRVLVLVSLTLQLCLLHFGSRRRYSVKTWLRVFLWLSYLGADSVATVALGVISNYQGNCNDSQLQNELIAFWAPFLLLHLGGQDTITAYAIQDSELWLRHLLGLVVQTGVALYIFLLYWKVSWLSFLTIPMFLAGFIKYAERTWVLKSVNYVSMTARADMLKACDELTYEEGQPNFQYLSKCHFINFSVPTELDPFKLFEIFRCLFLNQKIDMTDRAEVDHMDFGNSQNAWKMIEDELGYAYDAFYTKAPLFFTAWGFIFRFFSFTSLLFVFVLFFIKERPKHPQIDLIITYLLLVGAILTEIYGVILLVASNWPWPNHDGLVKHLRTLFTECRRCAKLTSKQRWSYSMGQFNLLRYCLKDESLQVGHATPKLFANFREWVFNQMLPKLNTELEMLFYMTHKPVSDELKNLVFNMFLEKRRSNSNGFSEEYDNYVTNGTESVETYQSIIIWHIATDFCFYADSGTNEPNLKLKEMSKDVSDYMMYLLAMFPFVLSTGNAKLSFETTCILVKRFIEHGGLSKLPQAEVCEKFQSNYTGLVAGDRCLPNEYLLHEYLLPLAADLANKLKQNDRKWELLSKFWVENLACVATLCQGNNHAQLLRKGGEFLTHVWLLLEHCNLGESFQKSRTKPQKEEAEVSPGLESSGRATSSVFESGYEQGSSNGSAAMSGADASTTSKTN